MAALHGSETRILKQIKKRSPTPLDHSDRAQEGDALPLRISGLQAALLNGLAEA